MVRELTITFPNIAAQSAAVNNTNKKVIFKNCPLFNSCLTEINNTKVDNAEDIDIIMSMYNLIEYINSYQRHQEVYGNTIEMNQSRQ